MQRNCNILEGVRSKFKDLKFFFFSYSLRKEQKEGRATWYFSSHRFENLLFTAGLFLQLTSLTNLHLSSQSDKKYVFDRSYLEFNWNYSSDPKLHRAALLHSGIERDLLTLLAYARVQWSAPPKFPNVPDFIVLYKCTPQFTTLPLLGYILCTDWIVSCKCPPKFSTVHWLDCIL